MMKKTSIFLVFFLFLGLLCACATPADSAQDSAPRGQSLQGASPSPPSALLDETMRFVDQQREGLNEPAALSAQVYRLDTVEVFVSTLTGGGQLISVREVASGNAYNIETPWMTAKWFTEEEGRILKFYTDGACFYGDQVFKPNDAWVWVQYDTQEVIDMQHLQDWGVRVGVLSSDIADHHFADCAVEDDRIIFRMELPPAGGADYSGTEIDLRHLPGRDNSYTIGFRNTSMTLSAAFLGDIRALEGIESVEASYVESSVYTGTEVVIGCREGYALEYYFNTDGSLEGFHDFYLVVVPQA